MQATGIWTWLIQYHAHKKSWLQNAGNQLHVNSFWDFPPFTSGSLVCERYSGQNIDIVVKILILWSKYWYCGQNIDIVVKIFILWSKYWFFGQNANFLVAKQLEYDKNIFSWRNFYRWKRTSCCSSDLTIPSTQVLSSWNFGVWSS